jgi:hypothetical protein
LRFEGVMRDKLFLKCSQRDICLYAMLASEWPACGAAMTQWLDDGNFDADGRQRAKLE